MTLTKVYPEFEADSVMTGNKSPEHSFLYLRRCQNLFSSKLITDYFFPSDGKSFHTHTNFPVAVELMPQFLLNSYISCHLFSSHKKDGMLKVLILGSFCIY